MLDRLDLLLGTPGSREHRFDWLLGDPSPSGRQVALPVDCYSRDLGLVVEIYERQHDHPIVHFDKPARVAVSGAHRGEQHRIYDQRRRDLVPAHGLTLPIVRTSQLASTPAGRLLRRPREDAVVLDRLVRDALAAPGRLHEATPGPTR